MTTENSETNRARFMHEDEKLMLLAEQGGLELENSSLKLQLIESLNKTAKLESLLVQVVLCPVFSKPVIDPVSQRILISVKEMLNMYVDPEELQEIEEQINQNRE